MLDMMKMLGKMKEVQGKIKEAQDNLVNVTVTGESGGGMVKAVVNGKKQLVKLDIDKEIINAEDKVMLQDLIVAAINKGLDEAEIVAKEELKKSTSGVLPNIPGLDLSGIV
jgi:nucleoid-associated protein EbfC